MRIAFIHPHKAFLPEIDAYQKFFSTFNVKTIVIRPDEIHQMNAEVEWHFMGMDKSEKKDGTIKIHEYASSSLTPFRKIKDTTKKIFSTKPDFRLFLNNYVAQQLNLKNDVPFGFRDMGVEIFDKKKVDIKYDFIYCGSVSKDMQFDKLLKCFTHDRLRDKNILILSKDYERYQYLYKSYQNILFEGPIEKNKVADYIRSARFAINYKPDIEPHNHQTSTKFLEYAACHVPIITTDFAWMRDFEKKFGGSYFYLQPDFSNFLWENVIAHAYSFPDLKEWTWEKQIRKSGVLEFLQTKFKNLSF